MNYIPVVCFIFLIVPMRLAASEDAAAANRETYGQSDAFGINYPGGNLKLYLSDSIAAELRGQYADKILTGGARLYYYPSVLDFNNTRLRPFLSVEGDYISFKGEFSKGLGAAFGGLLGVEYFLSRRVAVQTDAGPYCIILKDAGSSLRQSGLEFVLNFGVNFYFK